MRGHLTFGRDEFAYGLSVALREIGESKRATPKTARHFDNLYFSLFWWEHMYCLAEFLRCAGLKKGASAGPRINAGGFISFNPYPILSLCDSVCVGDAEGVASSIETGHHQSILRDNNSECVYNVARPIEAICHQTGDVTRVEIARGCKAKCSFCAVSHHKPYREVPIESIERAVAQCKSKRISLFAPETTQHSAHSRIAEAAKWRNLCRADTDVRLNAIDKFTGGVPRVGIEGISYALRKSINKGYTDEFIIESVAKCIAEGRSGIHMYFILDLPGECDNDWMALRSLFERIGKIKGSDKFLIKPSPSVFMPTPHTPMEHHKINWDVDYGKKWSSFWGRGKDRNWAAMVAERSRVFGPGQRILSMISTRAGDEFAELESEMRRKKAYAFTGGRPKCADLKKMLKILEGYGGVEKYCGERHERPWKKVTWKKDNA